MFTTTTYMTRQQRHNFLTMNGGIERGFRADYPVIAALADTNIVLDAIVDAYKANSMDRVRGIAMRVRHAEAAHAQLTLVDERMERIEPTRADVKAEEAGGETVYRPHHALCGFAGEAFADYVDAWSACIGHECMTYTDPGELPVPLARAVREAMIASDYLKGHPAPARMLASAAMLDEIIDALDAGSMDALGAAMRQVMDAENNDATRPFAGNEVVDANGNRVAKN